MSDSPDRRALFAIVFASLLSEYSLLVMPFIVGAMIDIYHLDESLAGQIVSVQLAGMALGAIGVSNRITKIDRRKCILYAAIFIVTANFVCAFGSSVSLLVLARFTTGVSEGVMMGVAGAIAAGTPRPEKTFSLVGLAVAIAASIALLLTPFIVEVYGRQGTFVFIAVFAALILPVVRWIPEAAIATTIKFNEAILKPIPLLALFSFAIFWSGCAGLWVFAERIGLYQGYSLPQIGLYLAIGQIAGIAGPIFVPFATRHLRIVHIFLVAICVNILAVVMFVYAPAGWVYSLGAALLSFWAMFLTPCYRILLTLIDRTGIVVAASVAFYTLGFGFAPLLISEFLGEDGGYGIIAIMCVAFFLVSIIAVWLPARRHCLKSNAHQ